jgi:hypothetical protein
MSLIDTRCLYKEIFLHSNMNAMNSHKRGGTTMISNITTQSIGKKVYKKNILQIIIDFTGHAVGNFSI